MTGVGALLGRQVLVRGRGREREDSRCFWSHEPSLGFNLKAFLCSSLSLFLIAFIVTCSRMKVNLKFFFLLPS